MSRARLTWKMLPLGVLLLVAASFAFGSPPTKKPAGGKVVRMTATGYCACTKCCGPDARGITASGKPVSANGSKFVAADRKYKFGTLVLVPGYDVKPVPVLDRGGAIRGNRLDVYFTSHQDALRWGVRRLNVRVLE